MLCLLSAASVALANPAWVVDRSGSADVDITQVVLSRAGDRTTLAWTPRVTARDTRMGMLLPVPPGTTLNDVTGISPDFITRYEEFTAPRIDRITCDDLVDRTYLYTAPGCRTTPEPEAVAEPRTAIEALRLEGGTLSARYGFELVDSDPDSALLTWDAWLAQEGLYVPDTVPIPVAERAAAGQLWLAVRADVDTPPAGDWLTPIRLSYSEPSLRLPMDVGAVNSPGTQQIVLYTVGSRENGRGDIASYPLTAVENECMVATGNPAAWYEAELAEIAAEPLPSWIIEYSGTPDACDPCVSDPLLDIEVGDFGFESGAALAWLTRMRIRYGPEGADREMIVRFKPTETDDLTRFIETRRELEFAYPLCGLGFPEQPAVCDELSPPGIETGGCATDSGRMAPAMLLLLALAGMRRRRTATVLVALLVALPAVAQERGRLNPVPSVELLGGMGAWSTPRVRVEGVDKAGPWPVNPTLSVDAIASVLRFRGGTLGVRAYADGFAGRSAPGSPESPVRFGLWEPGLGLTMRHGSFSDRRLQGFFRYGAGLQVSVLDSSVWIPHANLSLRLHAGAGAWIGREARRLALEVRVNAVPRTDAYQVTFQPNTRVPGWLYLPGYASASLHAGIAFP
ncbi:MAG: hypothetical protein ACI8PZ_003176 [Myxococcota bacterium]|jgi:hypothetical protein